MSHTLKLELQEVVNPKMSVLGTELKPSKEQQVLSTAELSLQPQGLFF